MGKSNFISLTIFTILVGICISTIIFSGVSLYNKFTQSDGYIVKTGETGRINRVVKTRTNEALIVPIKFSVTYENTLPYFRQSDMEHLVINKILEMMIHKKASDLSSDSGLNVLQYHTMEYLQKNLPDGVFLRSIKLDLDDETKEDLSKIRSAEVWKLIEDTRLFISEYEKQSFLVDEIIESHKTLYK
jgi:hypothetical protein